MCQRDIWTQAVGCFQCRHSFSMTPIQAVILFTQACFATMNSSFKRLDSEREHLNAPDIIECPFCSLMDKANTSHYFLVSVSYRLGASLLMQSSQVLEHRQCWQRLHSRVGLCVMSLLCCSVFLSAHSSRQSGLWPEEKVILS